MTTMRERAADQAYGHLRRDIVSGVLTAGMRLGEAELANRYGFSRTPIRESLRRLEAEGLVEILPRRGARVVDWSSVDVEAIYEIRALVEGYAARRAATRIATAEIERLSRLCDEMEDLTGQRRPGDAELVRRVAELNMDLHGSVATHAGQHQVSAMRNIIVVMPLLLRELNTFTASDLARSNMHHRELLAAFEARDPDWAAALMNSHIQAAKARLLQDFMSRKNSH
ncbi:GntR family transcriptional regulator [Actinacidiphila oryziradicis]|uniref:GntR family transcriptional regulator n=1 Tax=Actinacidiphila oryziradicis TaxID=2571141 RepID=A0A4U0RPK1_9ACTN|nr:GntR family transcriptional regulator [Actinacidiphila oryziradicis]TJZ97863.1 GntR family transcriptional regulator [Actinacidiphila oryziradicis]